MSDVLGFALVFGLVVSMVAIVTLVGVDGLRDVRDAEQADNAERAMEVLVDNLADIHEHGAPSRGTEIDLTGSQLSIGDPVTINVSGEDTSDGSTFAVERETVPLVYDVTDDVTFVYEAGLLVRLRDDTGTVVVEPPFDFGTDRMALPVLAYGGSSGRSVGGSTSLVRALHQKTTLSQADTSGRWDVVELNVTSPRYQRWHDALEDEPGVSDCQIISSEDKVYCTLDAPPERLYVTAVRIRFVIEG